jgi:hypothetical protein
MLTPYRFVLALAFFAAPILADGVAPVGAAACAAMRAHHVLNPGPVGCGRLSLVRFSYVGFDGAVHDDGEIVVLDAVADRVARIFAELRVRGLPIAKAKAMQVYDGNDDASMADDNTSAFNVRRATGKTTLSLHAYGVAIDVNPVENPYLACRDAACTVAPPAGAGFLNRTIDRPHKPKRLGAAEEIVAVFAENGFTDWGGHWDNPIDYQHFDIGRKLAEELATLPPDQAKARFEATIGR